MCGSLKAAKAKAADEARLNGALQYLCANPFTPAATWQPNIAAVARQFGVKSYHILHHCHLKLTP